MNKSYLIFLLLIVCSFSIYTDGSNNYRKYMIEDIPFNYRLNISTPDSFWTPIQDGAYAWNAIEGCYFEFNFAGLYNASSYNRDGINLVYFDFDGENFDEGTNVIAFSGTFTEGYGTENYRSVESDLIWNARDFPPALNASGVDPAAQDLQGVIAHEFGHHMGLGHTGDAGSPPGVGELIPSATMYGFGAAGDTTARSLHIDDIMGAISIYPRWKLLLAVSDSNGQFFDDYHLSFQNTISAKHDQPIIFGDVFQKAGYVRYDSLLVQDAQENFEMISFSSSFNLAIDKFGFLSFDTTIVFSEVIETPQLQQIDVVLKEAARNDVTLLFVNQNGDTINSVFRFFSYSDITQEAFLQDTISNSSSFSLNLPADMYDIEFEPDFPYAYGKIEGVTIDRDTNLVFILDIAEVLLVDDDNSDTTNYSNREEYYIRNVYRNLAKNIAYLDLKQGVSALQNGQISQIRDIIWFTGDNPDPYLLDQLPAVDSLFANNHNIVFSGNFLLSALAAEDFLAEKLFLEFGGLSQVQILRGIENEFISEGQILPISVASPQKMVALDVPGISPVFEYINSDSLGAVKYRGAYQYVLFSFALEDSLENFSTSQYLNRALQWFDIATSLKEKQAKLVTKFKLYNNFPNPFNPTTQILFDIEQPATVNLLIYNALGQKIKTLYSGQANTGRHRISWDGTNSRGTQVASGVYYYRLQSGNFVSTKKMILLR